LPNSTRSFDAVIIGGGVIGLAIAWRAARAGLSVGLFERGELGAGTSRVAAGMLAPIAEAAPTERPLLKLGIASAAGYPAFVEELAEASGSDPGYLACGTLMVARDRDEAEALDRELVMRQSLGLAVGRLRASEARTREPALAPTLRLALEMPEDHVIEPQRLTAALAGAAGNAGAELHARTAVAAVRRAGSRVEGVTLAGGELVHAQSVVIAAGVWSGELAGVPRGAMVPVRPVKGQILRLHDPAGPGLLTRVLRFQGGYIAPRGDGRYVLGATMEERGFDTTVTAGAVFELLRDGSELLPGLSELVIDELVAGLRPGTPDNAPAIGAGAVVGLHWAIGHYRNGILLAPLTAQITVCGLTGQPLPEGAQEATPARFAGATVSG
jgi:glycine oxidase